MIWRGKVASFLALLVVRFGDDDGASAWAPSNHSPKCSEPVSTKSLPFVSSDIFRQWAATGMVATSLVLTPLPSPAAAADTITVPGDAVRVQVDGTSLIIKLDLPELRAGTLGTKNVKAIVKQVPSDETSKSNSDGVMDDQAVNELNPTNDEQVKPVETKMEEPKVVVEKSMIEKMSEALIPNKDEKTETAKESATTETQSIEMKVETPAAASQETTEVEATIGETRTEEPKREEKSMIERMSEALMPSTDDKAEIPSENVVADKKLEEATKPAQMEDPKAEQTTTDEPKIDLKEEKSLTAKEQPEVAPSVPVSKADAPKQANVEKNEPKRPETPKEEVIKPVEAKKEELKPVSKSMEEEEKKAGVLAPVSQTKRDTATTDVVPKPPTAGSDGQKDEPKAKAVVETPKEEPKAVETLKTAATGAPKVIVKDLGGSKATTPVEKTTAPVDMETEKVNKPTLPVVTSKKMEAPKEAAKDADSLKPKPAPVLSPRIPKLPSEDNALNKFWNDFVSEHTETTELASETTFNDVPYWERPAFRMTVQKQMDGKKDLRLVFSNLDVARASVVGIGLASAVNFLYLRPMLGEGEAKDDKKDISQVARVPGTPRKPQGNEGPTQRPPTDVQVVSNEVSLNNFASNVKSRPPASTQKSNSYNGLSYVDQLGGASRNAAPTNGDTVVPQPTYRSESVSSRATRNNGGVEPPGSQVSPPRTIPPPYDPSRSDDPYSGDDGSGRQDRLGKRTSLSGSGGSGTDGEYKPDIGIIYYDSDELKEREQKAEESNEAKRGSSGSGSYLDDLSSNVNGYDRRRPPRNRGGADVFPFRRD